MNKKVDPRIKRDKVKVPPCGVSVSETASIATPDHTGRNTGVAPIITVGIDPANGSMGVALFIDGAYKDSVTLHMRENPQAVVPLLRDMFRIMPPCPMVEVFIEWNPALPKRAVAMMYWAAGTVHGVFLCRGVSMRLHWVSPSTWRKYMKFPQEKEKAKAAAVKHAKSLGVKVASVDEAEAIAIADAGHRMLSGL